MLVKASFPKMKKLVNVTAMTQETDAPDAARGAEDSPSALAEQIPAIPGAAPGKQLTPEAIRALEEAEARRQATARQELPTEINGRRDGEEPTRYGDWEKKGLAVDF
ncbi:MAG TPA: DUF1674 domain-containing protein [Hyphomonadaceae bacterium]|nr:DUF1674 domain-containing protein [Hyphomonadaceae bacterium]HPN04918.1 DUF1674 domain-containing protein [Hyphomonadaceae bacterium]